MNVQFLDLGAGLDELGGEVAAAFERVCRSGTFILGPEVQAFEHEFAEFCGVQHCIGVGSGFDALQLLLRAMRIGEGDEVLVPAYTAVATWMAVTAVGAVPIGVDVDAGTWTLDPAAASAAVTQRTKAVVPVHLFGMPADLDAVREVVDEHRLLLFEDAAQAHGARYRGERVGSFGHAATFSFYPTKNLGALGDGGAITTDDDELADRLRLLRAYGWRDRSRSEIKGFNSRLDELQAALLRIKLRRLDEWNERRRLLARRYLDGLAATAMTLPETREWADPVWHVFVVGVEGAAAVRSRLADRGIGTLVHYLPLPHLTPAYRRDGWGEGALPLAESLAAHAVSLPMYPQLPVEACDRVISALREVA